MNNVFDQNGRRIPFLGVRVFNETPRWYYKLKQPNIDYNSIYKRTTLYSKVNKNFTKNDFKSICVELKNRIQKKDLLRNLFGGVHVPFIAPMSQDEEDIGRVIEKTNLPAIAGSFTNEYPHLHCKAILQGSSKLAEEISVSKESRFQGFLDAQRNGSVVGWYFPQALQEYDLESQRKQMDSLPQFQNICLSGHSDTAAALIGSPGLLINETNYPPVLCLSALKHNDSKLMLCFKAYGHHLEFWCMSQMLTPDTTQVSEQWTGGLTVYTTVQ